MSSNERNVGVHTDNLKEILSGGKSDGDGEDVGPCSSRVMPKGWDGLLVFNGTEDTRGFQYIHMGFERFAADGLSFVYEFNHPEKWRITVHGRNLWPIFRGIHHKKIEWIRRSDRDFADDLQPIITNIVIEQIKEENP
jgi:hypothetical protein